MNSQRGGIFDISAHKIWSCPQRVPTHQHSEKQDKKLFPTVKKPVFERLLTAIELDLNNYKTDASYAKIDAS
jgi:hypothetical protein